MIAVVSGVLPLLDMALRSAPYSSNKTAHSVLWVRATECRAVRPSGLQALGFASKSRRSLRRVGMPAKPAAVRGLLRNMPFGYVGFGLPPASNIRRRLLTS